MSDQMHPEEPKSREELYDELVVRRQECNLCFDCDHGLANPYKTLLQYHGLDTEIGPWSRWQGNLYAKLMVVGKDWGPEMYLQPPEWACEGYKHKVRIFQERYFRKIGLEDMTNPTNRHLLELLSHIGLLGKEGKVDDGDWELRHRAGKVFFTNAVLCLRKGKKMTGPIRGEWFTNCVVKQNFLREQIEIVRPLIVVGLGLDAFNSIMRAFKLDESQSMKKAAERCEVEGGIKLPGVLRSPWCARAFAVYHCSALGWIKNHPGKSKEEKQEGHRRDWEKIGDALRLLAF